MRWETVRPAFQVVAWALLKTQDRVVQGTGEPARAAECELSLGVAFLDGNVNKRLPVSWSVPWAGSQWELYVPDRLQCHLQPVMPPGPPGPRASFTAELEESLRYLLGGALVYSEPLAPCLAAGVGSNGCLLF